MKTFLLIIILILLLLFAAANVNATITAIMSHPSDQEVTYCYI